MTILARQLPNHPWRPPSYICVRRGEVCDVTFEISDNQQNAPVDWSDRALRFRVYSQHIDHDVVVEVTDPQRCSFGPSGIWRLQLTADETRSMPVGGMCFTLEHRSPTGEFSLGVRGGISCREDKPTDLQRRIRSNPHFR